MSSSLSILTGLTADNLARIKELTSRKEYRQGQRIFSEGDIADEMYFIGAGRVSIVIQEFTNQEEVSVLPPGELFGEMAFFGGDKRSASAIALEDTTLLCLTKTDFLKLYEADKDIAVNINRILARRNEELALKETLLERPGAINRDLHIGIKGDPSLRESVFSRNRYESVVDQHLPLLQPQLYELLLHRGAYEISIHFNSGELHINTVFDPFNDEVHPSYKLVNKGYIDRHFPAIGYEQKTRMVKRIYDFLGNDPDFDRLAEPLQAGLRQGFRQWQPVAPTAIARILSKLPLLRKIPDLYLRNFTISTIRDAIRMQFNCDGAHFISVAAYEAFIEKNLPAIEPATDTTIERREHQRRNSPHRPIKTASGFGERRTPPGRRQEDWVTYTQQAAG